MVGVTRPAGGVPSTGQGAAGVTGLGLLKTQESESSFAEGKPGVRSGEPVFTVSSFLHGTVRGLWTSQEERHGQSFVVGGPL